MLASQRRPHEGRPRPEDVKDAEWIAQLLEHGLLRPSFVPPPPIRRLRLLTRCRVQLMGDRSRDAERLEKMLEDASIKISSVASSVTTVSACAMLAGLIAGEADPEVLAQLAKGKMRSKIPDLIEALTGHFDADHARLVAAMLGRLNRVEAALATLDQAIVEASRPWAHQVELLRTIPGVGLKTAQVIIAETGGDMSRFPSAAHLAAWAGVAPAIHESAGHRTPAGEGTGTSGSPRHWSRRPRRRHAVKTPTSRRSRPGSLPAAAPDGHRSLALTQSWTAPTTCLNATSRTTISDRSGCSIGTTRPVPDGW
ncbi:transposase [bacterium RCC_150]